MGIRSVWSINRLLPAHRESDSYPRPIMVAPTRIIHVTDAAENDDSDEDDDGEAAEAGACTAEFSGPARFLQRLQKLVKDDPIKGQHVLRLIADKVRRSAKGTGPAAARAFDLADRLLYVANTGDIAALTPAPNHDSPSRMPKAYRQTQPRRDGLAEFVAQGNSRISRIIANIRKP